MYLTVFLIITLQKIFIHMTQKFLPVYNINIPGGGMQPDISLPFDAPVYSSYTGELITYGPVNRGIMTDAPIGHPNYSKPFHVVEYNPVNQTFMMHGMGLNTYAPHYFPNMFTYNNMY